MVYGMIQLGYMECIGHFDIIKRTLPMLPLSEFIGPVKDCIESMKAWGIGFELNTTGCRQLNRECCDSAPEGCRLQTDMHLFGRRSSVPRYLNESE